MIILEDLITENAILRSRLEFAEKWMRREVATSILKIQKENISRKTRVNVNTIWEQDGLDMITERILSQFSVILPHAPRYTLERLIDADIYWHTLQQYPHMDALPIVLAYQKILDAWIEESLIAPFRIHMNYVHRDVSISRLDADIFSIITKNYTLSL